jgi:hypothetical protein
MSAANTRKMATANSVSGEPSGLQETRVAHQRGSNMSISLCIGRVPAVEVVLNAYGCFGSILAQQSRIRC